MSNYWQQRAIELENLLQQKTDQTVIQVNKLYKSSNRYIAEQIRKIFETYKKGGKIDSEYALQLLSTEQTAQQRRQLLLQLSQTKDEKARRELIAILDAPAYADRISRLQALSDYVTAQAIKIGCEELYYAETRFEDIAKTAYYRTLYHDQINEGKYYYFEKLTDKRVKAMLAHKWSGKHYSNRIWDNNAAFIDKLQHTVEFGCMAGMTLDEMVDGISKYCIGTDSDHGQRYIASRLIRTEVNYFSNQGILMGYQEAGIEHYQYLATLDLKTSEICRSLDLKVFSVDEAEAGVNLPPMHPFCRSVTIPYTKNQKGTRFARDAAGNAIKVPADMTYQQWSKKYVLSDEEEYAIKRYIGSDAYIINEKLRKDIPLTDDEKSFIMQLDSALEKMPTYSGDVTRSLRFESDSEAQKFVNGFTVGKEVSFKEYISTTSGGTYNPDGQVQIFIQDSTRGKNISKINNTEKEILYERNSVFIPVEIAKKDGITYIKLREG